MHGQDGVVPAHYMIDASHYEGAVGSLMSAGVTVLGADDIGGMTAEKLASIAEPLSVVEEHLESDPWDPLVIPTSHVGSTFDDSSDVPMALYADDALQSQSGWKSDVQDSFDQARYELDTEANVAMYKYILMTSGMPVNDVENRCQLQETSEYEEQFTHRGFGVLLFSPQEIEGHWGWTIHTPMHSQWEDASWMTDYCGDSSQEQWIPAAYVKHKPWDSLTYMKYLTAHESGHVWEMDHSKANCWGDSLTSHQHRTIMTFSSADSVPDDCDARASPDAHYHWVYTSANEDEAWDERQKVTTCYNNPDPQGNCA